MKTRRKITQIPSTLHYYCSEYLHKYIYRRGVPFTLGYVGLVNQDKCYNYVRPFPCMDKQDTGAGAGGAGLLINAIDMVMGQDGTIWVLDAGISDTLSDHPSRDGDPKIVGFNAATGKVINSKYDENNKLNVVLKKKFRSFYSAF